MKRLLLKLSGGDFSEKFLGGENKFLLIKNRVEQYVACMNVRDRLSGVLSTGKFEKTGAFVEKGGRRGLER